MRLIHGDCIEEMQKLIDEGIIVDMCFVDLPYGITNNAWDNIIPFEKMWDCINKIKRDKKTPCLFFASQPFTSKLVMSNLKWFRYEWIYQKRCGSNFGVVKYQPMKEHEEILVFGENTPHYYPIKEKRKGGGETRVKYAFKQSLPSDNYKGGLYKGRHLENRNDLRNPGSVRYCNNRAKGDRGLHPTQKPIKLLEYFIQTYSKENEVVLDFTMGSGSTGVACRNLNRDFIGIELNEEYFKIAQNRINENQTRLI